MNSINHALLQCMYTLTYACTMVDERLFDGGPSASGPTHAQSMDAYIDLRVHLTLFPKDTAVLIMHTRSPMHASVHTHAHTQARARAHTHTHTHTLKHTHKHTYVHARRYRRGHTRACTHAHTHACAHAHAHARTHMCACAHTCPVMSYLLSLRHTYALMQNHAHTLSISFMQPSPLHHSSRHAQECSHVQAD